MIMRGNRSKEMYKLFGKERSLYKETPKHTENCSKTWKLKVVHININTIPTEKQTQEIKEEKHIFCNSFSTKA
jgi:hypothetical protein